MRLLKLMVYGLLGYMIYELAQGMLSSGAMAGGSQEGGRRRDNRGRFMPADESSSQTNMTGPGEGREEETSDPDGTRTRHRVGRGVV